MSIVLNDKVYKILNKINYGTMSNCFVVSRDDKKYFLKLTTSDFELKENVNQVPFLYEHGKVFKYGTDYFYTLSEYISFNKLSKRITLTTEILNSFIKLFVEIHKLNKCIDDITIDNFVVDDNNVVYYVDRGGILEQSISYKSFKKAGDSEDPEEYYGFIDKEVSNYDELIAIYYLGKMLLENFDIVDNNVKNIVNKMSSFYRQERYKNFNEIELDVRKII